MNELYIEQILGFKEDEDTRGAGSEYNTWFRSDALLQGDTCLEYSAM